MGQQVYKITCDRAVAEEIVAELEKDREAAISVDEIGKPLAGVVETLTIVASLTTIGANLLTAWLAARPHLKKRVQVTEVER